jgi:tetratricopeptide (TPR) repeat protein
VPWYVWAGLAALVYLAYVSWRYRMLASAGAAQSRGRYDAAVGRIRSFLRSPLLPSGRSVRAFAHTQLADILYDIGRLGEAEREANAALEQIGRGPTAALAHLLLANILTAADRLDEAAIEARKALTTCGRPELAPRGRAYLICQMQAALAYVALAQVHLRRGDLDLARADAADALQRDPGCPPALVLLADLARRQGGFDEAIDLYAKLVIPDGAGREPVPERAAVAGFGIALGLEGKEDYAGAAQRLSQVLALGLASPSLHAVAGLELAVCMAALGKSDEAGRVLADAEPYLGALGENRELRAYELYNKGRLHSHLREFEAAVRDLTAAAEMAPGPNLLPEIYYALGETFREMGDAPRARDAYAKAAGVLPPGHFSEKATQRLAALP